MMYRVYSTGIVEVITGPMFAGKSAELIRRIRLLQYAKMKVLVVKPEVDDRWDSRKIISRSGLDIEVITVKDSNDIVNLLKEDRYEALAIDEFQFFDNNIISVVREAANKGIRVIASALDMDFSGEPFGPTPNLLAIADKITKLAAVCFRCTKAATISYRKGDSKQQVVVGDKEYEARCRKCHTEGMIDKTGEIGIV